MMARNPDAADPAVGRGEFLSLAAAGSVAAMFTATVAAQPATAVVRGNAPPPGYNKKPGSKSESPV